MEGIDRLLELQETDSAIVRAAARRRALESGATVEAARKASDAAETVLGETQLALDALARDQQRLEHEIDSLSQKAAAEEKRLYDGSIANAKELESLQHEVANLKDRRSSREDDLLEILEQREQLDAAVKLQQEEATLLRSALEDALGSSASELEQIGLDLAAREAARASIAAAIDPELLELYDDLRAQKKGIGVAALVDGVCGGCHEKLSAMELDRLKHAEGVKRCEHCRRILID